MSVLDGVLRKFTGIDAGFFTDAPEAGEWTAPDLVKHLHCPTCDTYEPTSSFQIPACSCGTPRELISRPIVPPKIHQAALNAGAWSKARKASTCACGRLILPGDTLIKVGGWLCEWCAA